MAVVSHSNDITAEQACTGPLAEILKQIRENTLTDANWLLLQSRVIGTHVVNGVVRPLPPGVRDERLSKPPFSTNSIQYVVHRHAQRAVLAYQTCLEEAERLQQRLYVATASDHVKGIPSEHLSNELRTKIFSHTNFNHTECMPGSLLLYIGMPLLIFDKICVNLGLMKGCECILEHIYFSTAEDEDAHWNCQNPIFLSHLPRGLLLRAKNAEWILPEKQLPPLKKNIDRRGLFLLRYSTDFFDFSESTQQEILPGVFKQVKQKHRVRRTQFMAVPACVRTVHIRQGEESDALIGDCSLPPRMEPGEQWLANYVILSRATTLEGLLLMRLPPRSLFSIGAPAHIVEELERLHKVELTSQQRLEAYVKLTKQRANLESKGVLPKQP